MDSRFRGNDGKAPRAMRSGQSRTHTQHHAPQRYASVIPSPDNGSALTGFPFASASAFANAGAIGGVPGSPTPVGFALEGRMCTSIAGI